MGQDCTSWNGQRRSANDWLCISPGPQRRRARSPSHPSCGPQVPGHCGPPCSCPGSPGCSQRRNPPAPGGQLQQECTGSAHVQRVCELSSHYLLTLKGITTAPPVKNLLIEEDPCCRTFIESVLCWSHCKSSYALLILGGHCVDLVHSRSRGTIM